MHTPPIDLDTWIISDTHFGHQAIQRLCDRPADHEQRMITLWNERVGKDDLVLHLGDVAYKGRDDYVRPLLRRLSGRKLMLRGNHDKKTAEWYASCGFTVLDECLVGIYWTATQRKIENAGFYWHGPHGEKILFSHYPDARKLDWTINAHGHLHSNPYSAACPINRDYRNVSVEVVGYGPQRLGEILNGQPGVNFGTIRLAGVHAIEH